MAADKQVNVPINYKVNVIEVEHAEKRLHSAQKATDQLRQSTQQFGNQSAQSFKFTSKAVEGMEIELARLRQQIKLTSVEDTKRLSDLTQKYKLAKQQLDAYNKSLFQQTKETKAAAAASKDMAMQFSNVYNMVRSVIAAGLARELLNIQLAAAKLSGTVEGVEKAFYRIPNATILIHDLREATHGTVNDLELMQKALQAQNFKIPLENLGTLLDFAAVKAQQTGQEVNHLVDYIVSGIGYRSIKRLDDLGFTANRVKEALGGVSLQAATMPQVMAAITKLMNEDLAKTGGYAETSATKVKLIETALHELEVTASKRVTNNAVLSFLENIIKVSNRVLKMKFEWADYWRLVAGPVAFVSGLKDRYDEIQLQEQITQAAEDRASAFKRTNDLLQERQKIINADSELFDLAKKIEMYKNLKKANEDELKVLKERKLQIDLTGFSRRLTNDEKKELEQADKKIEKNAQLNESYDQTVKILTETVQILADYRTSLNPINDGLNDQKGLIKAVQDEIEGIEDAIIDAKTVEEITLLNYQLSVLEVTLKRLKSSGANPLVSGIGSKTNANLLKIDKSEHNALLGRDLQKEFQAILNNMTLTLPTPKYEGDGSDLMPTDWEIAWEENKKALAFASIDITENLLQSEIQREADAYQQRISNTRKFYENQISLAGDNEKAKQLLRIKEQREIDRLNREAAVKERRMKLASILLSTAAGIARAFVDYKWPYALIPAAIVAGQGAVQYAAASRAQGFAKGGIDIKGGTPGKDSIPAMIMPGESVITTEKTKQSKNTLKMIHSGKLNDRILKDIVSGRSGGISGNAVFDDSKLLKKLDEVKNATPDVIKRADMVYEVRKKGDGYKQYIRSKSMGY